MTWTLGDPGQCAIKTPGRGILLGELKKTQCRDLAEQTIELNLPAVVGPDQTAKWFTERAIELGQEFCDPIPQSIHALTHAPRYPSTNGHARQVTPDDAARLVNWLMAFHYEATPNDPLPEKAQLAALPEQGQHHFWVVNDEPVSLACIARRTRHTGCISSVYTPSKFRKKGYAGSVVASLVERIFDEGLKAACLYTDLRNPASNRCYAKIGFRPVYDSQAYFRNMG